MTVPATRPLLLNWANAGALAEAGPRTRLPGTAARGDPPRLVENKPAGRGNRVARIAVGGRAAQPKRPRADLVQWASATDRAVELERDRVGDVHCRCGV